MSTLSLSNRQSTFQELANFLTVLNGNKNSKESLLKRADSSSRVILSLERQFSKTHQEPVFRRLGKHRQLALNFAQAS